MCHPNVRLGARARLGLWVGLGGGKRESLTSLLLLSVVFIVFCVGVVVSSALHHIQLHVAIFGLDILLHPAVVSSLSGAAAGVVTFAMLYCPPQSDVAFLAPLYYLCFYPAAAFVLGVPQMRSQNSEIAFAAIPSPAPLTVLFCSGLGTFCSCVAAALCRCCSGLGNLCRSRASALREPY